MIPTGENECRRGYAEWRNPYRGQADTSDRVCGFIVAIADPCTTLAQRSH